MARRKPVRVADDEERFMRLALRLARRGEGRVEPNPMVGCVLVKGGHVVGQGYHRTFGGPHAEVFALRQAGVKARGATAYVTLEPCNYFGKTPPCTEALIRAGVRRVVASALDPNPRVNGGGLKRLIEAGLDATAGLCADEGEELIAPFRTLTLHGRPHVIAKWAQSLDGKIASASGESKWLSGEASRRQVHELRARVDAILVGIGTVLRDDPLLTARDVAVRRIASRIVLDSSLRIPLRSQLVRSIEAAPLLLATSRASAAGAKAARLRGLGADLLPLPERGGRLHLPSLLRHLGSFSMTRLLVEGGSAVLSAFFDGGWVDEARVYVAPMLIGHRAAPSPLDARLETRLNAAIRPRIVEWETCGLDRVCRMRLT